MGVTEGTIVKGIGGFYYVRSVDKTYQCKARGIFRKDGMIPYVGDRVEIEPLVDEEAALLIVILFVLYVFLGGLNGVGPLGKHLDRHDDHVQFNEPVQELPESGLLTAPYNDEILARFLVHAGETQKHFLLKLINVEDYSLEPMLIFIRQGESKEVAVPLGVYRLKYCTGNVWYGDEHLFGPSTNYYEKPELLEFYAEDSYVHGIELTMTYVPDGDGGLKETERKFW